MNSNKENNMYGIHYKIDFIPGALGKYQPGRGNAGYTTVWFSDKSTAEAFAAELPACCYMPYVKRGNGLVFKKASR